MRSATGGAILLLALLAARPAYASGGEHVVDDGAVETPVFRDQERSVLKVGEHRKHGKAPFAGRQG